MKSKSKFIIALVLFGVVTIGAIAGIIAVVASFNANVESNFKVSYTAQNVHATVSAGYVVSDKDSRSPSNLTYTPIKAGSAEQIEFNAGDEAEEVEKSFDGLTLDIKKNQYVYFKYTFTHTGDETNSMKFLNIALTKDFTQFENLTMEYSMEITEHELTETSWNSEINELTAVRGEDNVTDVYIRMYVTTKTKDAKLDGMLNWILTGSEEYAYENAYITGDYLSLRLLGSGISPTSITFDYLDADTESIVDSAVTTIPVYSDGSYGVNAYVVGTDVYVLSEYNIKATNCMGMFYYMPITNIVLDNLDTSNVANMSAMFGYCGGLTAIDLSSLNTSNAINMKGMFTYCTNLTSIDLTPLDTSNVTNMQYMFANCANLTSIDLSPLDTSKVTNMRSMFNGCTGLTSIDLTPLDTSNVTDMSFMFYNCTSLTSIDLSGLDTSNVTNMNYMFRDCTGLTEVNLTGIDMSSVTSVSDMFNGCTNLSTINLTNAKMGTTMSSMFEGCTGLTSIDLSGLDTSNVTSMYGMFYGCTGLTSIDLSPLDTSNVTDMSFMFYNCTSLTEVNLTGIDMSSVTSVSNMFNGCTGKLDIIGLDMRDSAKVRSIFNGCSCGIKLIDAQVGTDMSEMFKYCTSLTSIDLSGLDTSNVTAMNYMFQGCTGLTSIDLTPLDTSNVTGMSNMFSGCTNLVTIYADESFDTSNVTSSADMFNNCTSLVGGNGTVFNSSYNYKTYARIDKAGTPGYFTLKEEG